MQTAKRAARSRCNSCAERKSNGRATPCQNHHLDNTSRPATPAPRTPSPTKKYPAQSRSSSKNSVSPTKDQSSTWAQQRQLEGMSIRAIRAEREVDTAFSEDGKIVTAPVRVEAASTTFTARSQAPAHLPQETNNTLSDDDLQLSTIVSSPRTSSSNTNHTDDDTPSHSTNSRPATRDTTSDNEALFEFDPSDPASKSDVPVFYRSPVSPQSYFDSPTDDNFLLPPRINEPLDDLFQQGFGAESQISALDSLSQESGPLDSFHGLRDIRKVSSSPFLHRSYTAPEKSFMTLQERRLQLRNRHLQASPVMSSVGFDERPAANPKKNTKPGQGQYATISHPKQTPPRKGLDTLMGAFDGIENFKSSSAIADLTNASISSIQASLSHRRTPTEENSNYIEHLERQVADLNIRLQSYTNPASEKSHAAVVQRLNNKVRSLENQIAEWENVFDDRVKEAEKTHAEIERMHVNQLKVLRQQLHTLDVVNVGLLEEIDNERKENAALRLELTEKKAIALDNAKLAEALKKTFATIERLEKEVREREKDNIDINNATAPEATFTRISDIISQEFDVDEEQEDEEEMKDEESPSMPSMPSLPSNPGSPYTSPDDASMPSTPGPVGKRGPRRSYADRARKMRKFPRGLPGPTQLLMSPAAESVSSSSYSRPGSSEYFSSVDLGKNSPRFSIPKEISIPESGSLFAELAKAQNEDSLASDVEEVETVFRRNNAPYDRDNTFPPPSPTDTDTSTESAASHTSCKPTTKPSLGLADLFFVPFRITTTVMTTVGYGILNPRRIVRAASNKAYTALIEMGDVDVIGDGLDITIDMPEASFDPRPMEQFRLYQQIDQYQQEHQHEVGLYDSFRWTVGGLRIPQNTNAANEAPPMTHSVARRKSRRETGMRALGMGPKQEVAKSSAIEETKQIHLASTMNQLEAATKLHRATVESRRTNRWPSMAALAQLREREAQTPHQNLSINTDSLSTAPKRGFLPIRPIAGMQSTSGTGRRVSLPPPYSEHMRHRTHKPAHTQSGSSEEGEVDRDREALLVIPESELARVLKNDIRNGSLIKAMGLYKESPMVLWAKLLLSFMMTLFVAVRDGPEIALERTAWKRRDYREVVVEEVVGGDD